MKITKRSIYNFTTFELQDTKSILAGHLFVGLKSEREMLAKDTFELLQVVYDKLGGFKSFKDIDHYINNSYLWYITYDGPISNLDEFDVNKVYAISIYRKRFGLKGVAIARKPINSILDTSDVRRVYADAAFDAHLQFVLKRGWCEVSGKAENRLQAISNGKYVIDPNELMQHNVFRNIEIDSDGLHYFRPLRSGEVPTRKIAYGTIKF